MQVTLARLQAPILISRIADERIPASEQLAPDTQGLSRVDSLLHVTHSLPTPTPDPQVPCAHGSPSPTPSTLPLYGTSQLEQDVNAHELSTSAPELRDQVTSQPIQFRSPSESPRRGENQISRLPITKPRSPSNGPPPSSPGSPIPNQAADEGSVWPSLSTVVPGVTLSSSQPNLAAIHSPGATIPNPTTHESGVQPTLSAVLIDTSASSHSQPSLPPLSSGLSIPNPATHESGVRPPLSQVSVVISPRSCTTARAVPSPVGSGFSIPERSELQATPPPNQPSSGTLPAVHRSRLPSRAPSSDSQSATASSQSQLASSNLQSQQASRKRPHSQITARYTALSPPPPFTLNSDWTRSTPVRETIKDQGFYISTEATQFGNDGCLPGILKQLNTYQLCSTGLRDTRLDTCYHSLLQQALVQNPHVYLTALAAMNTLNHRMISLPVAPMYFPGQRDSKLMDPSFPFADFIASEPSVAGTRLLYSLGEANIRIAQNPFHKSAVNEWWEKCGGNLEEAAKQLPLDEFPSAELLPGEFVVFPPQKPWYVERCSSMNSSTRTTEPQLRKIFEVRYIPVTPEHKLNFAYWAEGSYNKISRFNRDLLGPTVTGWGEASESPLSGKRFFPSIEMRGVWAIGDALLGLTSWSSPRVELELQQLFDAPQGEWFNRAFIDKVQDSFDKELNSLVEILASVREGIN